MIATFRRVGILREIVCKPDFLLASYNSVSWVIKGHGYVILNKARYIHLYTWKNASLCVNGWRPDWALLQWKERDFPPIRVMFVRYVSLFRGRAVGRSKNTGGGQVAIQNLLKETFLNLFLLLPPCNPSSDGLSWDRTQRAQEKTPPPSVLSWA